MNDRVHPQGEPPLVSVVIPAFNGAAFLTTALDSVFAQDYQPIEVIVVDDGSTDETARIVHSYAVVRFVQQDNRGNAAARNAGVAAARGDFIAFLDQDDLWAPNKLRLQIDYLLANPDVGYVLTGIQPLLAPDAEWPNALNQAHYDSNPAGYTPSTLLTRRSALELVGQFNTHYKVASDVDWFFRAQEAGLPMAVLPEALVHKRIHAASQSSETSSVSLELLHAVRARMERRRSAGNVERH